jgi:hypothetical protein
VKGLQLAHPRCLHLDNLAGVLALINRQPLLLYTHHGHAAALLLLCCCCLQNSSISRPALPGGCQQCCQRLPPCLSCLGALVAPAAAPVPRGQAAVITAHQQRPRAAWGGRRGKAQAGDPARSARVWLQQHMDVFLGCMCWPGCCSWGLRMSRVVKLFSAAGHR